MHIKQFYDSGLAQASYAISSNNEIVLIDPARDPEPYLAFARENHAKIIGIIETHPHADFVSSHLELYNRTGAPIYTSKLVGADYPHQPFDEGDSIRIGHHKLSALNTPGHSPDSICVLLTDEDGNEQALFTGDTLFVGDVGRPDLRENVGNMHAKAAELAKAMYLSLRDKIMTLPPHVRVYPAHGAGSLCGKNMSTELESTIGKELKDNPALQEMQEEDFIKFLTADQPFIPKYFMLDVALNRLGAPDLEASLSHVIRTEESEIENTTALIIDARPAGAFKAGHYPQAINIPDGTKFETWVGSIIAPGESFYLLVEQERLANTLLRKLAKIGYESQCKGYLTSFTASKTSPTFDLSSFRKNENAFTIIDIRNDSEVSEGSLFKEAIHIPLPRLRESLPVIPDDKPIVVHCAGGYRSAIGSSIIAPSVGVPVYDLSTAVNEFT
ncbi:MBL fold metallo-hydrolase [Olivibacter sp. XZL3]|uniref:MBL fold metallo-hydrolase n=1 Tax=Olivibacter sp. XZL3 TaxID=1735116 RepID=UPI00106563BA|nr:MBL fold metallo-hydrolase [Olivibacter sp. XZL3]